MTIAHNMYREIISIARFFQDEVGKNNQIRWTVFRVGGLANGQSKEEKISSGFIGGNSTNYIVRRGDVAYWLLEQIKKESESVECWQYQMPVIGTRGLTWANLRFLG